jgi:hypothetical protein
MAVGACQLQRHATLTGHIFWLKDDTLGDPDLLPPTGRGGSREMLRHGVTSVD